MKKILILFFILTVNIYSQNLNVITLDNYYPFMYKKDGIKTGMATDIVNLILRHSKVKYYIKTFPWTRAYNSVLTNNDTMLYTTYKTEDRENLFRWIGPIIPPSNMYLFKLKKNEIKINTIEDIREYSVGVIRGVKNHSYLIELGMSDHNIVAVNSMEQEIKMLYSNRIDLIIADSITLIPALKSFGYSKLDVEEVMLFREGELSYMAFNKNISIKTFNIIQNSYNEMINSGEIQDILIRYYNELGILNIPVLEPSK
ncbi:MAG: transporter substrate-binding domain-containing protein [Spirochaetaceae bacterium]